MAETSHTLRSPFNGAVVTFPPETDPATLEALLKAGFTVLNDERPEPVHVLKQSQKYRKEMR